jgi:hypothetical protein
MKRFAFALAIAAAVLAGCATHRTTLYEYQVVRTVQGVNERAAEGWTVVTMTNTREGHEFLLKRPRHATRPE